MRTGSNAQPARRPKGRGRAPVPSVSNLQAFFASTTPFVPVHPADPLTSPPSSDLHFSFLDLWASFDEWSAYGAAVPITLPGKSNEKVTSYYAPSLSAIQIFAQEATTLRGLSSSGDEDCCSGSDGETLEDSSDDSSVSSINTGGEVDHFDSSEAACQSNGIQSGALQRGNSVLCKQRVMGQPGKLLFHFCEDESPYNRLPLTEKVEELALQEGGYTGLLSLRSCDIHPASWFAVAWYPIYHLPAGRSIRELGASFLTFHSLTLGPEHQGVTPSQELLHARPCSPLLCPPAASILEERDSEIREVTGRKVDYATLIPFAYAPYRMQGPLWHEPSTNMSKSMRAAARAWVERRHFSHSDFEFFTRSTTPAKASSSGCNRRTVTYAACATGGHIDSSKSELMIPPLPAAVPVIPEQDLAPRQR